jgi:hypothetical protein
MLGGFTFYKNSVGSYARTFPSVIYLLTGKEYAYDMPSEEYVEQAYMQSKFLDELHAAGYKTRLFASREAVSPESLFFLEGKVDNVSEGDRIVKTKEAIDGIGEMTRYRYAPHALKASYWVEPGIFDATVYFGEDMEPKYVVDDMAFNDGLQERGLVAQSEQPFFSLYHLYGAHPPVKMDENCNPATGETTMTEQAKGTLKIVSLYLEELKRNKLFESSTVIIMSDHGDPAPLLTGTGVSCPIFLMKPAGINGGERLRESMAPISHEDFRATILEQMGISDATYGKSVLYIGEDEDRQRSYRALFWDEKKNEGVYKTYIIHGYANDYSSWELIEERKAEYAGL